MRAITAWVTRLCLCLHPIFISPGGWKDDDSLARSLTQSLTQPTRSLPHSQPVQALYCAVWSLVYMEM